MERVLDIYKRPYDEKFPVVCYDEMPRQLLEDVREIQPMRPGRSKRVDYEYRRMGTCNVLLASEPLRGWRMADVTQTKTEKDWAMFTEKIVGTVNRMVCDRVRELFPYQPQIRHWNAELPPIPAFAKV